MGFMQRMQRIRYTIDSNVAETNNEYVMYHSVCLIVIIVISSLVQTYFIKNLFNNPTKGKPSA